MCVCGVFLNVLKQKFSVVLVSLERPVLCVVN